jgi:putative thioredoxin
VLARLDAEGLAPSPEADKTTLLRRVTLDLTGLPPTPEEVDAFLADQAADAYERALKQNLKDSDAVAGLAHVHLMKRVAEIEADAARVKATMVSGDLASAFDAADLDLFAGQTQAAFDRLLAELPGADIETKEQIRVRMVEYFNLIGPADPVVGKARQRLSLYLY